MKTIQSQIDLIIERYVNDAIQRTHFQRENIVFRRALREFLQFQWNNPATIQSIGFPWRPPASLDGSNLNVRAAALANPVVVSQSKYPFELIGSSAMMIGQSSLDQDTSRLRGFNATGGSRAVGDSSVVFGSLLTFNNQNGGNVEGGTNPGVITQSEIPTTQIGIPYTHPVYWATATTNAGQPYLTVVAMTAGQSGTIYSLLQRHTGSVARIDGGADKGLYYVRHYDRTNARLYLVNMDGTLFSASATASGVSIAFGIRLAYFNEASIGIQGTDIGAGTVAFGGVYTPGENRASYLLRLHYEKSGSPSPADPSQTGNYWFSLRPMLYGSGNGTNSAVAYRDDGSVFSSAIVDTAKSLLTLTSVAAVVCETNGLVLDRTNQRLWYSAENGTGGSIGWWRYKTPETIHEVASSIGTPNDPLAGIVLTGSRATGIDIGSDESVYVSLRGTNGGLVRIAPDLTVSQFLTATYGLGTIVAGLKVDKSRARTGAAGSFSSAGGSGAVTIIGANFTQSDVERVVKVTGNDAAGLYRVGSVSGATTAVLKNLDGSAVSLPVVVGAGTFEIGDRIYLFFGDTTSSPGKVTFTESLAFGTIITRTVAMTNGARAVIHTGTGVRLYVASPTAIDQATGVLFWGSDDTTLQVNRYDPTANTWSRRLASDFSGLNGGVGTTPEAPTHIAALGVNPNPYFPELWIAFQYTGGVAKLSLNDFAGSYNRYFGAGVSTDYAKPAGYLHPVNHWATSNGIASFAFGIDGRVFGVAPTTTPNSTPTEIVGYDREMDLWATAGGSSSGSSAGPIAPIPILVTPYGEFVQVNTGSAATAAYGGVVVGTATVHYQWIGGVWVPKEVVRGTVPNAAMQPGCLCKTLHTTLDDLILGVKVKFTAQGGATPANREFVGRIGQSRPSNADGATTNASNNFDGSGFVASDAGRYLYIESGAQQGLYVIQSYTNANRVVLKKLNPGTTWSSTATEAGLTYSVWEVESTANQFAGPSNTSVWLVNGVSKDNTQSVANIQYEMFYGKTTLSDQIEGVKTAIPFIGAPGSVAPAFYQEGYLRTASPSYNPGIPAHLALPGSPFTDGHYVLDGTMDDRTDGTNGKLAPTTSGLGNWGGTSAAMNCSGIAWTADLGADVEVGAVIVRGWGERAPGGNPGTASHLLQTDTSGGALQHLLNAPDGATPANSSVARTNGTGLSITVGTSTLSVATGDLLGPVVVSAADGVVVAGEGLIASTAGRFTARDGMILKVTTGSDVGSYRIVTVNGDGSQATIRNLDQSAKTWAASAAGLSFEVRDGVREDDMIAVPSIAGATHKLSIERLLTPTTAQVRVTPSGTISNAAWECAKPTWNVLKRVSYSVEGVPPDVVGNGTFVSVDGREQGTVNTGAVGAVTDWKAVVDLSDLATAKRTGRWWKFATMPRWIGNATAIFGITSMEFFSPTGERIGLVVDNRLDTVADPTFMACHVTRVDWIQATNASSSHIAGVNGLAALGGVEGDTVTLAGGAKFLGRQVRSGASATPQAASNIVNLGGSETFIASDIGRFIRLDGTIYRIATRPSTTQVTVTTPAGNVVSFGASGATAYTIHEGLNSGLSNPDFIAFTTGGLSPTNIEVPILTLSDDLTTITLATKLYTTLANQNWEIRRRAVPTSWTTVAADATKTARLVYGSNCAPRQPGDIQQDSRGYFAFHADDFGQQITRTDGAAAGGSGVFTGSSFSPDDVGRVLRVNSGANKGPYRIGGYTDGATVTLVNLYTGAAVSLAVQGAISYTLIGERRFRASRYATVHRT